MAEKKPETRYHDRTIAIPRDPQKAAELVKKTISNIKGAPFWRANKLACFLPTGVRGYPEVAVVDQSDVHFKEGYVLLKYYDGAVATLPAKKMYKGELVEPRFITKKWVVAKPGERNLHGHEFDE